MPTIPPTLAARNSGEQQVHFIRKRCKFADLSALAAGVKIGRLPARAFIAAVKLHVETAYNSATTDTLQLGSTQTGVDILAATSVHATGFTNATAAAGLGLAVTGSSELDVWVKYAQSGAAASAGDATIVIEYTPDNDN